MPLVLLSLPPACIIHLQLLTEMDKGIKTLTRLSLILRKWSTVSSSTASNRPIPHVLQCNFANYSVSQEEKNRLKRTGNNKTVNDTPEKEIYNLLENMTDEKDSKKGMNAFAALHELAKLCRQAQHNCQTEDIISHKGFLTLCDRLTIKSRSLPPNELIICLRNLVDLSVPVNSVIVQRFLQLIRPSINKLTLPMNVSLLRMLEQNTDTKLSKALHEASEIIFEEQLRKDLNTQNTKILLLCLQQVIKSNNNKEINRIVYAMQRLTKIDAKYLASTFISLCHVPHISRTYRNLMDRVQNELAAELTNPTVPNSVSWAEDKIIYYITKKYKTKFQRMYNTPLMNAIVNNAISRKLPFETCVKIASYLRSTRQLDLPLLDFIAIQFCERNNEGTLIEDDLYTCAEFIECLAFSDYKPFLWEPIQQHLMKLTELKFSIPELISLCHSLAILDCDCPVLLKELFDTLGDVKFLYRKERFCLVRLYCAIKTFGTKYSGPLADNAIMTLADDFYDYCTNQYPRHDFKEALAQALGGEQYFRSNLRTKLGHFVDYAIVIGKDGHPEPISECEERTSLYLEDMQISPTDRVLSIFALPPEAYVDHRINGTWSMTLRSLEVYTGCDIVPINYTVWENSEPSDKISCILQAIKLKCDVLSATKDDYRKEFAEINCESSDVKSYISPDFKS